MDINTSYYVDLLLSTHRGSKNGLPCNAKPLYLLTIMKGIETGLLIGNQLRYVDPLIDLYNETCLYYEPSKPVTPFFKPYFHLTSEPYYYIRWKVGVTPPKAARTPSPKFLRENVEFACLDDTLWDLLQDVFKREEIRNTIIHQFIDDK